MTKYIIFFHLVFYLPTPTLKANENPSWSLSQVSKLKYYQVDLFCDHPPTLGAFQKCSLILSDNNKSKKISNTNIIIEGGMPEHHHGLPTAPKVTWDSKKNKYVIDGLKFSMPGAWQLTLLIDKTANLPRDITTINLIID